MERRHERDDEASVTIWSSNVVTDVVEEKVGNLPGLFRTNPRATASEDLFLKEEGVQNYGIAELRSSFSEPDRECL